MTTKLSHPCKQKKHQKRNRNLPIDFGKPKVPLYKAIRKKSLERLEDWEGAS